MVYNITTIIYKLIFIFLDENSSSTAYAESLISLLSISSNALPSVRHCYWGQYNLVKLWY